MSSNLRYQQPAVRDHLASHYVLGTQTRRVRRRCEQLIRQDPELEARVYQWQNQMNPINDNIKPVEAPKRVWRDLQSQLDAAAPQRGGWWMTLPFWRTCCALLLMLSLGLWWQPQTPGHRAVDYMAVMHLVPAQAEPSLVITAYKGDAPGRSQLHLQWNKRLDPAQLDGLSLWAINRDTGQTTNLGALDRAQSQRLLTKPEWLAIKDSVELVVVRGASFDGPVLFRGPCLQLSPWQDQPSPS
ncbi:MAG: hypothetical protein V7752_06525 [Halopseudomonas sp.]